MDGGWVGGGAWIGWGMGRGVGWGMGRGVGGGRVEWWGHLSFLPRAWPASPSQAGWSCRAHESHLGTPPWQETNTRRLRLFSRGPSGPRGPRGLEPLGEASSKRCWGPGKERLGLQPLCKGRGQETRQRPWAPPPHPQAPTGADAGWGREAAKLSLFILSCVFQHFCSESGGLYNQKSTVLESQSVPAGG